jgi:hypothetical protein
MGLKTMGKTVEPAVLAIRDEDMASHESKVSKKESVLKKNLAI